MSIVACLVVAFIEGNTNNTMTQTGRRGEREREGGRTEKGERKRERERERPSLERSN